MQAAVIHKEHVLSLAEDITVQIQGERNRPWRPFAPVAAHRGIEKDRERILP